MSNIQHTLTPVQQAALDGLLDGLQAGSLAVLEGDAGAGKTTIFQHLHRIRGGALVGMAEFVQSLESHTPSAVEEAYVHMLEAALADHDVVIADDLHLVQAVAESCYNARSGLFDGMLTGLLDSLPDSKKLVFASEAYPPAPVSRRAYRTTVENAAAADYQALCSAYLGEAGSGLDYAEVHRFGPKLNGHQLRNACQWLLEHTDGSITTQGLLDYLQSQHLVSNVRLKEVAPVELKDLKGADDVIRALEAKIALPFENAQLAAQLGLKPKRGVLLAGPPGTGKTTIGRALAHRLKSKFFLIDGTVIAGSDGFYGRVERIFEAAKRNAPAIIFIDDADVIFEQSEDRGFFRYLLTMLDGLESASVERVCVMMTAMQPGSLPPALVRSGRIELWLETRPPDETARREIFKDRIAGLPPPVCDADTALLASASRGLTGADIKAVVEDAKLLYAADVLRAETSRPVEDYFLEAIDTVRANGRRYTQHKPLRPTGAGKLGFLDLDELDLEEEIDGLCRLHDSKPRA